MRTFFFAAIALALCFGTALILANTKRAPLPGALAGYPLEIVWGGSSPSHSTLVTRVGEWMSAQPNGNWSQSDFGAIRPGVLLATSYVPFGEGDTYPVSIFSMHNGTWQRSGEFTVRGRPDYLLASSEVLTTRSAGGAMAYRVGSKEAVALEVPPGLRRLSVSESGRWIGVGSDGIFLGREAEGCLVISSQLPVPDDVAADAGIMSLSIAWLHSDRIAVLGEMHVIDLDAESIHRLDLPAHPQMRVTPCVGGGPGRCSFSRP